MNQRLFNYGGLQVVLFQSEKYGWVTTTGELAKGCGVARETLERVCKKHGLIMKESVVIDHELGAKMHLIVSNELAAKTQLIPRGPKPSVFWTIEGMTFVAMYMGTATCDQFRNEVLRTIKSLEQQGFVNSAEVMKRLATLENMVQQLVAGMAVLSEENRQLKANQNGFNQLEASFAGRRLQAHKIHNTIQ